MATALKLSEAASLALHAMVFLAAHPGRRWSARALARKLRGSEAHLAKVLQRLVKAGLVDSARGRNGGFKLARAQSRIRLIDVYQAVEGKLARGHCLMDRPVCGGSKCILGGLLRTLDTWLRAYLSGTKLSQLTDVYGGGSGRSQEDRED